MLINKKTQLTQQIKLRITQVLFSFLLLTILSLSNFTNSNAQLFSPRPPELSCNSVYEIQQLYLNKHVTYHSIKSPNLEKRAIDQFIKMLDGSKMYLLESDVKKIESSLKGLFAKLLKNDCTGIEKANEIFNQRVSDRVEFVKKKLVDSFKFDPKTKIVLNPDSRPRAKSKAELDKFHVSYLQYQIANFLAMDLTEDEAKKRVVRNYERIKRRITETSPKEQLASYLESFARALDPHSSYLSKESLEDFEITMRLSLEGIGATLSSQDGFTVIEQLIPGGAAFGSGKLKAKDKIVEVAQGEDGEPQSVIEMDLRDVVRLIRGKKGTKVKLTILRKETDGAKRFSVVLVRDKIKLEDDAAQITYFDRKVNGNNKKIALLTLPSFYADNRLKGRSASDDMKKLIEEAKKEKADAMVLDLSNNGGGSLDDAVKIAGLFFRVGNVVKQSGRSEVRGPSILADRDIAVDWPGPLVVLVNRASASASEIVSGALKDYNRAVIVGGDHTFGKGTVQSVEYLPPGLGAMKTTIGMFFTAGGKSTQHIGVDSDIVFPSIYSNDKIGEKTMDYSLPPKTLPPFLSSQAYVAEGEGAWKPVNRDTIKILKEKSEERVQASEDFKKIIKNIEKVKKQGDVIDVSEVFKDKKKDKDTKGIKSDSEKNTDIASGDLTEEEEDESNLSREERKKRYFKRPDVVEAVNIAADMVAYYGGELVPMTIGAKPSDSKPKN